MRYLLIAILVSLSLYVFGQDDDMDSALDFSEAEPLALETPYKQKEPELKKTTIECRCQCLTLGVVPKNDLSFAGFDIDGKCVCPCAPLY